MFKLLETGYNNLRADHSYFFNLFKNAIPFKWIWRFLCSEKRLVLHREMNLKIIIHKKPPHRSVVTPI